MQTAQDVGDSKDTVRSIAMLIKEYEQYENFGSLYLSGLSRLSGTLPILKHFLGRTISSAEEIERRSAVVKELMSILMPFLDKRYIEVERQASEKNSEGTAKKHSVHVSDALQLFAETGVNPHSAFIVRVFYALRRLTNTNHFLSFPDCNYCNATEYG